MTDNQDEPTKMTKGAVALTFLFGIYVMTIWVLYIEFLRTKIVDWSGIQVTNNWFEFVVFLLTGVVMISLLFRYRKVINWLDDRFFTTEEVNIKLVSMAILVFFVHVLISGLILLSVLAFIFGTGYSLEVFSQPTMGTNESLLLLFFFILGVTVVTLTISEALKFLDKYLLDDSEPELDSKKINEIYAMLISQGVGQTPDEDNAPIDEEA